MKQGSFLVFIYDESIQSFWTQLLCSVASNHLGSFICDTNLVTSSLPNSPTERRRLPCIRREVPAIETQHRTNVAGLLPSDFPIADISEQNISHRSLRRDVPAPIATSSYTKAENGKSSPRPISRTEGDPASKDSPPQSPLRRPSAATLFSVFGPMTAHL